MLCRHVLWIWLRDADLLGWDAKERVGRSPVRNCIHGTVVVIEACKLSLGEGRIFSCHAAALVILWKAFVEAHC
jgi:hypothetical protein